MIEAVTYYNDWLKKTTIFLGNLSLSLKENWLLCRAWSCHFWSGLRHRRRDPLALLPYAI